jgi:hypothetical protein
MYRARRLVLAVLATVVLAGCGGGNDQPQSQSTAAPSTSDAKSGSNGNQLASKG